MEIADTKTIPSESFDMLINDALVGQVVQHFTYTESALRNVGTTVDKLIGCEDTDSIMEAVSSMYLFLNTLQRSADDFLHCVSDYMDYQKEKTALSSEVDKS